MHVHSRTARRTPHRLAAAGAVAVVLTAAGPSVAQAAPATQAYKD
jgi:hypothetical protein